MSGDTCGDCTRGLPRQTVTKSFFGKINTKGVNEKKVCSLVISKLRHFIILLLDAVCDKECISALHKGYDKKCDGVCKEPDKA